ncbi:MAG TPA: peptidoglycan editing factor PgeF [Vicinamibacteria bacterium]
MLRAARVAALEEVPGLVHGFEQRLGPAGWEERDATRRRVASALERSGRLLLLKQVHGASVRRAPWSGRPEADAAVAEAPGLLLGIETADCLPILIVDPVRRAVAAAHAGWRGTAAGVARAAVAALVESGSRTEDLLAATGPGIGPCCYEVGDELRAAFGEGGAEFFRPGPRGRPRLDVRAANERQLREAGIPEAHIHRVDDCTRCRADLYHSYRREGNAAGRMISFVGFSG